MKPLTFFEPADLSYSTTTSTSTEKTFVTIPYPYPPVEMACINAPTIDYSYSNEKGEPEMAKDYYTYDKEEEKAKKKRFFSKIDKWKMFKQVVTMAASGCATMVISRYLKANMPESENIFEKATMAVGMYCITGIVGTKVAEYAEQELDSWRDSITSMEALTEGGDDDGIQ